MPSAKGTLGVWVVIGGLLVAPAWADEIHLKGGDRLTGRILAEEPDRLLLEHEAAGTVRIDPAHIERIVRAKHPEPARATLPPKEPEKQLWQRKVAFGYNVNRGNTENAQLSGELSASRKTDHDEWTLKSNGFYSASSRKMDAQRYRGMGRYAFSFGPRMAWYNFYKLEADHDRFANVDWRAIPSVGLGYWFADQPGWQAIAEMGIGWERTEYRDTTPTRSDAVLVPRVFASKTLIGQTTLSEDLTVWPNLSDTGAYRLRAETVLTNPIAAGLSLEVKFIDEFDSDPAGATKKNDARVISSLVYDF